MTTASEPHATMRRRGDIEGLRGVAILSVVLYHAGLGWVSGGYVGVDAFFVVSGFLITTLLWREAEATGRIAFGAFYARRARRLLPAAVLVIVATVVASKVWMPPLRAVGVGKDGIAASAYVANYRFAAGPTGYLEAATAPSPLQHYWSLGVEEQFYLVWPALVLAVFAFVLRRGRHGAAVPLAVAGVVSFVACVWLTTTSPSIAFYGLPTRTWEFVVGGLVAISAARWRRLGDRAASLLAGAG